jgi:hypothetical protein
VTHEPVGIITAKNAPSTSDLPMAMRNISHFRPVSALVQVTISLRRPIPIIFGGSWQFVICLRVVALNGSKRRQISLEVMVDLCNLSRFET